MVSLQLHLSLTTSPQKRIRRRDRRLRRRSCASAKLTNQAKTAIAPLDRVKILFQTSNAEFAQYAGTPRGLVGATGHIYRTTGIRGLFQGHSATLLRIFPYAGIKFMAYDTLERVSF